MTCISAEAFSIPLPWIHGHCAVSVYGPIQKQNRNTKNLTEKTLSENSLSSYLGGGGRLNRWTDGGVLLMIFWPFS